MAEPASTPVPILRGVRGNRPKPETPHLVLIPEIGTDSTIWSSMISMLPSFLEVHALDLPGHGKSPTLKRTGKIGAFVKAIEDRLHDLNVRDAVLLGHGLGGLVAQGLAAKRLDLVRAVILSGTATKIETRARWDAVAAAIRSEGPNALTTHIGRRWSRPGAGASMPIDFGLTATQSLAQAAEAIASADFYTTTAALRLPALIMVGAQDAFTPPDLARETANIIPGSQFALVPRAGHLAMIDAPNSYASIVTTFLQSIGHIPD